MAEKRTLLVPSLLDDWFPLLRYAFASDHWEPVLLGGDWRELERAGQRCLHNDLCVPFVLISGQVLTALREQQLAAGCLKGVLTPYNRGWALGALLEELRRERGAIASKAEAEEGGAGA